MTNTEHDYIEIPAYAADTLGESMTLAAPIEWHERIAALSPFVCYGDSYSRGIKDNLLDMSNTVSTGYSDVAYDYLLNAERRAGVA